MCKFSFGHIGIVVQDISYYSISDSSGAFSVVERSHWDSTSSNLLDISLNPIVSLQRSPQWRRILEEDETGVQIFVKVPYRFRFFPGPLVDKTSQSFPSLGFGGNLEDMQSS